MSDDLPYDPDDPPADPPSGSDPLLWRLAYALHQAHRVRGDGWCECRQFAPCEGRVLAEAGFATACGLDRRGDAQALLGGRPNHGHW